MQVPANIGINDWRWGNFCLYSILCLIIYLVCLIILSAAQHPRIRVIIPAPGRQGHIISPTHFLCHPISSPSHRSLSSTPAAAAVMTSWSHRDHSVIWTHRSAEVAAVVPAAVAAVSSTTATATAAPCPATTCIARGWCSSPPTAATPPCTPGENDYFVDRYCLVVTQTIPNFPRAVSTDELLTTCHLSPEG